jgi:hypothetical protein
MLARASADPWRSGSALPAAEQLEGLLNHSEWSGISRVAYVDPLTRPGVWIRFWFRKLQIPRYSGQGMMIRSGNHEATFSVFAKALKIASSKSRPQPITARRAKGADHGCIDFMHVMLQPAAVAPEARAPAQAVSHRICGSFSKVF